MPDNLPSKEILLDMFEKVTRIKTNDEHIIRAIRTGKMALPYYSGRGQEIIPAALAVNLTDEDYLCTIYRGIHDSVAKGIPLPELWAELGGKATGSCKGKGGPMHITYPAKGIMVTTGIVGSSMPIANGLAWASQLSGDGRVAVATFGDGASNIGAFHEALNLASVWNLPVVFVCQNNGYAEHTRMAVGTAIDKISKRADSYTMPGFTVDGNDPVEMYSAAKDAIDRARSGGGPTLLECITFRFNGHNLGDDDPYMLPGEKAGHAAKDPFPLFRAMLIEKGYATEDDLQKLQARIDAEVDAAEEFMLKSPTPDPIEVRRDVYEQEVA